MVKLGVNEVVSEGSGDDDGALVLLRFYCAPVIV